MEVADESELKRRFDAVVAGLKIRPYPTPQAIANTYEIAVIEYPNAKGLNPLSLWDLHWVKDFDDERVYRWGCQAISRITSLAQSRGK